MIATAFPNLEICLVIFISGFNLPCCMKKDLIVAKIEASADGSHIHVTFSDPKESRPGNQNQFEPNPKDFSSMEDLMRNMPKIITNIPGLMGGNIQVDKTTLKFTMKEYEDFGFKVGDRVTFSVEKSDASGV